jgi:hypothetical protein
MAISIEKYATNLLCPGRSQEGCGGRPAKGVCVVISGDPHFLLARSGYRRRLDSILFVVHAAPKACKMRWSPWLR